MTDVILTTSLKCVSTEGTILARPKTAAGEVVVLYEAEATEVGKGAKALMVGFMDGHVEFMGEEGMREKLKAQGEGK